MDSHLEIVASRNVTFLIVSNSVRDSPALAHLHASPLPRAALRHRRFQLVVQHKDRNELRRWPRVRSIAHRETFASSVEKQTEQFADFRAILPSVGDPPLREVAPGFWGQFLPLKPAVSRSGRFSSERIISKRTRRMLRSMPSALARW